MIKIPMSTIEQASRWHVDAPFAPKKSIRILILDEPVMSYLDSDTSIFPKCKYCDLIFRWDVDRYVFDPKDQNFDFCIIF